MGKKMGIWAWKKILFIHVFSSPLAVRNGNKSPGQKTCLGNRERLKVLNDTKLVLNEHE